ncbi:MAG: recombination regulator RecX [Propionibacteriaceae bacterium]|nr:recombination regulator RecX [Propionibacteriaceae bacterium]
MGDEERLAQIEALRAAIAAIPADAGGIESSGTRDTVEIRDAVESRDGIQMEDPVGSRVKAEVRSRDGSAPTADLDKAREIALHRLTYRARSRAELLDDLVQRGVTSETAADVVDRFTRVGLLDDREFAAEWVRCRQGPKSLSSARLRAELRAKGIDDGIIDTVLGSSPDDDEAVAMKLATRKVQGMAALDRPVAQRRLAAYLARKGYAPSVVWRAVRAVLGEASSGMNGTIDRDE